MDNTAQRKLLEGIMRQHESDWIRLESKRLLAQTIFNDKKITAEDKKIAQDQINLLVGQQDDLTKKHEGIKLQYQTIPEPIISEPEPILNPSIISENNV